MEQNNKQIDPKNELLQPHDMLIEANEKDGRSQTTHTNKPQVEFTSSTKQVNKTKRKIRKWIMIIAVISVVYFFLLFASFHFTPIKSYNAPISPSVSIIPTAAEINSSVNRQYNTDLSGFPIISSAILINDDEKDAVVSTCYRFSNPCRTYVFQINKSYAEIVTTYGKRSMWDGWRCGGGGGFEVTLWHCWKNEKNFYFTMYGDQNKTTLTISVPIKP